MVSDIDLEAISQWIATGFFLDHKYFLLKNNLPKNVKHPKINWHHTPSKITYEETLNQFSAIIEKIISKIDDNYKIVLPISGGLDSRTLACALSGRKNVISYSYEFEGGVKETNYAKKIAEICGFEFHSFKIPNGYIWNQIDQLSKITRCKTEFTHPRQMAVIKKVSSFGDILISGLIGDILFDSFDIPNGSNQNSILDYVMTITCKDAGLELAEDLWKYWKLEGSCRDSIKLIFKNKLEALSISNPISLIRAFKIDNYVQNWANINLDVFSNYIETHTPYQDEMMCEFVCNTPEKYLKKRQIQIDYIKSMSPDLASVSWQKYDLNLYNYKYFNSIYLPRRIFRYINRLIKEKYLPIETVVQRNWEIQFLGDSNSKALEYWLFGNPIFHKIISQEIVKKYYDKFLNGDKVKYSHAVSMMLTLSVWCKKFWKRK